MFKIWTETLYWGHLLNWGLTKPSHGNTYKFKSRWLECLKFIVNSFCQKNLVKQQIVTSNANATKKNKCWVIFFSTDTWRSWFPSWSRSTSARWCRRNSVTSASASPRQTGRSSCPFGVLTRRQSKRTLRTVKTRSFINDVTVCHPRKSIVCASEYDPQCISY